MQTVEQYTIFELNLSGPSEGNPYQQVNLCARFTDGTQVISMQGFYKGDGHYAIRFMPSRAGMWHYETQSNAGEMDGQSGQFRCVPHTGQNHGPVYLAKDVLGEEGKDRFGEALPYSFCYADGTRFLPFGTTCYAWIQQPAAVQKETLKNLGQSPFNKIRMCIFPKYYTYNTEDPERYPFPGNRQDGFDFTRFDELFFERLDQQIAALDDLGIEADIILLHPYDRWGFSQMTKEQDIFYLSYVVRRYSAYKNVWWSLANEYDLMPQKSLADWDCYAHIVMENDPYHHLRSIHNCIPFFDYRKDWITHVSVQRVDVYKTAEIISDLRETYQKPVIMDEAGYEGNIGIGWGALTGEELTRRFWEGCLRGGFLSHGETFVDRGPYIWWSHGGMLYGDSPRRIAFLQEIMTDAPEDCVQLKLTPENHEANWDVTCFQDEQYRLYYYGFFRMAFREFVLPEDEAWQVERIDTWNMTVETLPGTYSGKIRIDMPNRQYMAVRMKRIR